MGQTYQTTKYRLPDSVYERDFHMEREYGIDELRLYGYAESDSSLCIVGEVIAKTNPKNSFCLICGIYDKDGDVIESIESRSYGSGLVTSMIAPASFFNGFPFAFYLYGINTDNILKIRITPASSY